MSSADGVVGTLRPASVAPRPFAAAVGVSLLLHVGFFWAIPSVPSRASPSVDAVYVELGPPPEAAPPEPLPPSSPEKPPAEAPAPPGTARAPAPLPEPEQAVSSRPQADARTPIAQATAQAAPGPPSPAAPLPAADSAPARLAGAVPRERPQAPPTAQETKAQAKTLAELMPSSKELATFRSSKLPDPAGGGAKEATLGLGENDVRYQGYVDRVRTEIYAGWHMGRGLVVAGRSHRVVVRFSLNSLGMVDTPTVVQSSGNPTLDAEAVDAVRRAKLAPFPNNWTLERLFLFAVFDYEFR